MPKLKKKTEKIILAEIQLILSEKRTSLSLMRTGLAVFALPLSVLSVLIATSRYYNVMQVIHLLVPLLAICAALIILGGYLIIRALVKIRYYDRAIAKFKAKNSAISEFIE